MEDLPTVLALPLPDAFDKRLPSQIMSRLALRFFERPLDDVLRGDSRMIQPRQPERFVALHPAKARDCILNRVLERMAHVQLPGHVGRRHHDDVRLFFGINVGLEEVVILPESVPLLLNLCRIVGRARLRLVCALRLLCSSLADLVLCQHAENFISV